jgi:hypothetical protein
MTDITNKTSSAPGALLVHDPRGQSSEPKPLTIPVSEACRLSGLGATTIWQFIRDRRLEIVRVPGIKRTLIIYDSLARLLAPTACPSQSAPRRKRRRPRKFSGTVGGAI